MFTVVKSKVKISQNCVTFSEHLYELYNSLKKISCFENLINSRLVLNNSKNSYFKDIGLNLNRYKICTFVQSKCTFANANANFYATFKLIIAKFRKVLLGSSLIHNNSNTIYESQKVRISKYLTKHQIGSSFDWYVFSTKTSCAIF